MQVTDLNSRVVLQGRAASGKLTWTWPVLIVFARLFFAILARASLPFYFSGRHHLHMKPPAGGGRFTASSSIWVVFSW